MASKITRIEAREQDPRQRARNFNEVSFGFTPEEAQLEASRCLQCKNRPCVGACPVNIQIPDFIRAVLEGDFSGAAEVIARDSLLPSVCGRVCPQETQCEGSCVLGIKGQPVNIGKLERFVGDFDLARSGDFRPESVAVNFQRPQPPSGGADESRGDSGSSRRKVAIIGSGPAGLACAADLAKMGREVTIFEALHRPGGVLVYGIPEFRLPKENVVAKEIEKLTALGVRIETDVVVGRTLTIEDLLNPDKGDFGAVFVGTGAGLPNFMGIAGENLNGVVSANEFLTRANLMGAWSGDAVDTPIFVGARTVVVGGGNVAMDAVRTALRLGSEATIVYRRSEAELPARREEVHHAREEGVGFQMLTNPVEILGDERGWVRAIKCVRMELGEPDASGRRSPVEVAGSEFEIACEGVVMALGTSPNPLIAATTAGLETNRRGGVVASETGATSLAGVFAGGDAVTGAATVILAMGAGRRAARAIDEYLRSR